MIKLFLDDERNPYQVTWVNIHKNNEVWNIVRSYKEFVSFVTDYGCPDYVTFDHDLADTHYARMLLDTDDTKDYDYGPEKTGYDCAKFLVDYCIEHAINFPEYEVHSMNPIGSKRIRDYIEWAKEKVDTL